MVILGVELLLQDQELLPVLLPDGGQGVDVVLELCSGCLLASRVCQPGTETFDQLVVRHPGTQGQHIQRIPVF